MYKVTLDTLRKKMTKKGMKINKYIRPLVIVFEQI